VLGKQGSFPSRASSPISICKEQAEGMHKGSGCSCTLPFVCSVDRAEQNTQCFSWKLLAPVNQLFTDWICGNAGFVWAELLVKTVGVVLHV